MQSVVSKRWIAVLFIAASSAARSASAHSANCVDFQIVDDAQSGLSADSSIAVYIVRGLARCDAPQVASATVPLPAGASPHDIADEVERAFEPYASSGINVDALHTGDTFGIVNVCLPPGSRPFGICVSNGFEARTVSAVCPKSSVDLDGGEQSMLARHLDMVGCWPPVPVLGRHGALLGMAALLGCAAAIARKRAGACSGSERHRD